MNRLVAMRGDCPKVAVVIPCYRVERQVEAVVRGIPAWVTLIVAVDDGCPGGSAAVLRKIGDPRLVVIQHPRNLGVGAAMVTGYRECLDRGVHVIVKMDGDGQMAASDLPRLIWPLRTEGADYVKGNRWHDAALGAKMPRIRRVGNLVLSFMAKLASGHWQVFDPCSGFTAIDARVLQRLDFARIAADYYFEISMLVELGIVGAVVHDVEIDAIYAGEPSSLRIGRVLVTFPRKLAGSLLRRVWVKYFVREFGPLTLFLAAGCGLLTWASVFGTIAWTRSFLTGVPATAGTVMLSAMPGLIGFQLLLQALVLDIQGNRQAPLSSRKWHQNYREWPESSEEKAA